MVFPRPGMGFQSQWSLKASTSMRPRPFSTSFPGVVRTGRAALASRTVMRTIRSPGEHGEPDGGVKVLALAAFDGVADELGGHTSGAVG